MIKSNWPMKNLIMSSDLIFMKLRPIIIYFDLEFVFFFYIFVHNGVQLGLKCSSKLQLYFSACFLPVVNLYFIFFYIRKDFLGNNPELGYDNYNAEFGVDLGIIKLKVLGFLHNIDLEVYLE